MPVLRALAAVADPEPEDLAFTVERDTDNGVDGPVGDLAVTDLDVDRVDEHDRVEPVQRTRLPRRELLETASVIREIVSRETSAPYTSAKCAAISPVVSPFAASEITSSSTPANRRCRFATIFGSNEPSRSRGTSISTSPTSVKHRLRPAAVARVALVAARGGVLGVTEVVVELRLERRLQHRLRQPGQQATRPDQLDTFAPRPLNKLLRELLIRPSAHQHSSSATV